MYRDRTVQHLFKTDQMPKAPEDSAISVINHLYPLIRAYCKNIVFDIREEDILFF